MKYTWSNDNQWVKIIDAQVLSNSEISQLCDHIPERRRLQELRWRLASVQLRVEWP